MHKLLFTRGVDKLEMIGYHLHLPETIMSPLRARRGPSRRKTYSTFKFLFRNSTTSNNVLVCNHTVRKDDLFFFILQPTQTTHKVAASQFTNSFGFQNPEHYSNLELQLNLTISIAATFPL